MIQYAPIFVFSQKLFMMRICVAAGIFHPESGGPATYLYRILPEVQARGHSVRVLTFGDAPTAEYPYPLRRIPRRALPIRMADYARAAFAESLRADLIYINSLGLPLYGMNHKPRVLKVVGDLAWERAVNKGWIPATEDIDQFQSRTYNWRVRMIQGQRAHEVQRMDRIIVPSSYLRDMVIGWGAPPDRVQVIYNAFSPNAKASTLTQAESRAEIGLGSNPILLTVARLVPWKGIDYLIRAIRQIPDVHLLIAGDGPDESRLRAVATSENVADRVEFLGRVPRERLAQIYRAADYTMLYSGYEGLSHVLLESLLAGTPVIASDKGGNPETVRHNVNGLLVSYPDENALIDSIRTALSGDTRARLAAQTNIDLDKFRWETMVNATLTALEAVCAS
jgi:glycosyltransferase involved in cell wall biosynthesis